MRSDELAAAQEACVEAMRHIAGVDGVNVHGSVQITVDITAFTHVGFDTDEGREMRTKIYAAQVEIMDRFPDVLFDFKVR